MVPNLSPKRIQRKNLYDYTWQQNPNAVYVGRPSPWGNPFKVSDFGLDQCLIKYEAWLTEKLASDPHFLDPLRGKDLVCFCPLNQSCHADIIMRFLNEVPCIVEQSFGCLDKYFPEKPTAAQKRDFEKIVFG